MKHAKNLRFNQASLSHSTGFSCLGGNDVVTQKVSDHHPVIHDGVFFWNVMMQCNKRGGGPGFNNGFGLIESDIEYIARLVKVAQVIAEAVYQDTSIEAISLCEGPIKPEHVAILFHALMAFPFMNRFMTEDMFHKPAAKGLNWGILMLADTRYAVTKVRFDSIEDYPKLANRFQVWKLEQTGQEKYIALAHFPFAGDEYKTEKIALSAHGQEYCSLINTLMKNYSNDSLIFCADFNFNPYLISQWRDRALDKISHNNSILRTSRKHVKTVTVDGVLLSLREKQKYHYSRPEPGLFGQLKSEYRFFQAHVKHVFWDLVQNEHGKQFGLVPYHSL
ncbi:MAG: hypothetical protein Q8R83_03510 [Legionellaceae bacterium]|nr:hypothetical protein [Legionellaceae bacterium]